MCYYNRLVVPVEHQLTLGGLPIEWEGGRLPDRPLQSGFEYGDWPIIVWSQKKGKPIGWTGHWEFLPPWLKNWEEVKASREKYSTLNAVGEQLGESRMYKDAALKRRCLVPSSGFYEWRHLKTPASKKDQAFPYYVYVPGQPVFYMAGIWQPFTDTETGELLISFAIVTQPANPLMEQIHNKKKRMPMILTNTAAEQWISPALEEQQVKNLVTEKLPSAALAAFPLKKDFRHAMDPLEPETYAELPELVW